MSPNLNAKKILIKFPRAAGFPKMWSIEMKLG